MPGYSDQARRLASVLHNVRADQSRRLVAALRRRPNASPQRKQPAWVWWTCGGLFVFIVFLVIIGEPPEEEDASGSPQSPTVAKPISTPTLTPRPTMISRPRQTGVLFPTPTPMPSMGDGSIREACVAAARMERMVDKLDGVQLEREIRALMTAMVSTSNEPLNLMAGLIALMMAQYPAEYSEQVEAVREILGGLDIYIETCWDLVG